jgi:hypothetical protein
MEKDNPNGTREIVNMNMKHIMLVVQIIVILLACFVSYLYGFQEALSISCVERMIIP